RPARSCPRMSCITLRSRSQGPKPTQGATRILRLASGRSAAQLGRLMKTPSFTRRRRRRISGLLGVLHAGAAAGLALAAPPAVLDRVPLDVDAVVAVESVARLDEDVQRLLTAIEL